MNRKLSLESLETRYVPSAGSFLVASGIVHSTENYGNFITAEYSNMLGRAPDVVGFNFYMAQLQAGVAPEVIDAEFVTSAEYFHEHSSTAAGWVDGLYRNILARAPSSSELNFWATALGRGATLNQVALDFTTSVERDIDVVTADYHNLLGRALDTAGLNFFVGALRTGADRFAVESVIIASNEYIGDHANNAASFIGGAYQNVLQRSASNAEVVFWLDVLSSHGGL